MALHCIANIYKSHSVIKDCANIADIYDLSTFDCAINMNIPLHTVIIIPNDSGKIVIINDKESMFFPNDDIFKSKMISIPMSKIMTKYCKYIMVSYNLYITSPICDTKYSPPIVHYYHSAFDSQDDIYVGNPKYINTFDDSGALIIYSSTKCSIILYFYEICRTIYTRDIYRKKIHITNILIHNHINMHFKVDINDTKICLNIPIFKIMCIDTINTSKLNKETYIKDITWKSHNFSFTYKIFKLYNHCYKLYLHKIIYGDNITIYICVFDKNVFCHCNDDIGDDMEILSYNYESNLYCTPLDYFDNYIVYSYCYHKYISR
jgi:hypothetical protein